MTTQAYTGTSRTEYLNWIANWKAEYKTLSTMIRTTKASRKPYLYEYRDPKDTAVQRRVNIGDNPNYDRSADFKLFMLREEARNMMIQREQAKESARIQRAAEMLEAA